MAHRLRCVVARWTCRARISKTSSIRFDRAIGRPRSMLSCIGTALVCEELAAPDRGVLQAGSDEGLRKRESLFRTMDTEESCPPACTSVRLKPCPVESDAILCPERPLQSHLCEAS